MTTQSLTPWERNPRTIDEKAKAGLKKSLEEFGDLASIVVNIRNQRLISGHQRSAIIGEYASIEIDRRYDPPTSVGTTAEGSIIIGGERFKYREVDWPEEKHAAANIAANSQEISGEYTSELLALLDEVNISMPDLSRDLRFDSLRKEVSELFEQHTREDEVPETPTEPRTKPGDLFALGNHRLLCGDSTIKADVEKLMEVDKAQLIFTDAPYNVDYESAAGRSYSSTDFGGNGNKIFNDDKSEGECLEFYTAVLKNAFNFSTDDASIYWWFASKNQHINREALMNAGWYISQMLIWVKEHFVFARSQDYHRMYEPCLLAWKKGRKHYTNRSLSTLTDLFSLDRIDFQEQFDIWYEKRDITNNYVHPTQKPVRLAERAMRKNSRAGDIVLDLFGGSGSTLIAAHQLQRRCNLIELDPKFCDVIVQRYVNFTGNEKIILNGEEITWNNGLSQKLV